MSRLSRSHARRHVGGPRPRRPRLTVVRTAGLTTVLTAVAMLVVLAPTAAAAPGGAAMPWDAPLTALLSNLTGTVARVLVTVAVVAAGLFWAFTRHEEGVKRLGQIAFGGAIALSAVTLMASLGFAGGRL